jgi:hypothetical protein
MSASLPRTDEGRTQVRSLRVYQATIESYKCMYLTMDTRTGGVSLDSERKRRTVAHV